MNTGRRNSGPCPVAPATGWRNGRSGLCGIRAILASVGLCCSWAAQAQTPSVTIGSKAFTESYLLAEMMAQVLEDRGFTVRRRTGLGGTLVAFQALQSGQIDAYPEYTGTLSQVIFEAQGDVGEAELGPALAPLGVELLPRLGFNNTYALAVTSETVNRPGFTGDSLV